MPANARIAQSEEVHTADREAELNAAGTTHTASALAAFDLRLPDTKRAGIETEWIDVAGMAQQIVEEQGRRPDVLVSGQPAPHEYGTSWQAMRAALLATGRPILMPRGYPAADAAQKI